MRLLILFGLVLSILTAGCCCALTPESSSSGFCPYGTYGSACSYVCTKANVPNCVSTCLDDVRAEGLGDATTCCPSTFRQDCDDICTDLAISTNGGESKADCMDNCLANYEAVGVNPDTCAIPI
ncbi:Uncharacterised protein [Candidatus Bilamarchaeum dharawalense]|uniref:Uncharacterized protein n=1 Tax=Candidatus Bilamarchaeum dharawalense TaxID=2885759 RepID=A0A5E4LPA3_9ARCH|nr:Uncharacterised protein [Candidatus Bilamarchaeum dharawalense]